MGVTIYFRHVFPAAFLALATWTCVKSGQSLGRKERASWSLVTAPPLSRMSTSRLDLVTLGHRGLYDDFVTIWAIQFLGDPNLKMKTTADELSRALDAVTQIKPRVESLYLLSCFVLAFDFDRAENCESIMIRGSQALPSSWRIPLIQGFISSIQLKDPIKASAFYRLAASRPGCPNYAASLAEKLAAEGFSDGRSIDDTIALMRLIPNGDRIIEALKSNAEVLRPNENGGDHP